MEPIWMNGEEMIEFEKSQGDYCYFYENGDVVIVNSNWDYFVGLDEMEKNAIVFGVKK